MLVDNGKRQRVILRKKNVYKKYIKIQDFIGSDIFENFNSEQQ